MKYGLIGSSGRLGREVNSLFDDNNHSVVLKYDIEGEWKSGTPELIIDCSLLEVFEKSIGYANKFKVPFIIATTGLSEVHFSEMKKFSKHFPVVQSYNFSIGIQVLLKLAEIAKSKLSGWDVEISETHHRFKKDKPSGTAKMIKEIFNNDNVNITSRRLGNVPGDHSISFGGMGEMVSISHRALSRRAFAEGILKSAEFVLEKESGFYTFSDVVFAED